VLNILDSKSDDSGRELINSYFFCWQTIFVVYKSYQDNSKADL